MHDPSHVILRRGLRVALVLPLTYLFVANVLQFEFGATYAVFGTFALLGICDFGGPAKDKARAYLLTGVAGLVSITLGSVTAYNFGVAIATTFIVGTLLSFSTVLRGYVSSAQMGVLLPFVIAVTAVPELSQLPQRLAGFAIATVISTAAAILLWPSHVRSSLRVQIADTLEATSNLMRSMWPLADSDSTVSVAARQRELREQTHRLRDQYEGRMMRPGTATSRDRSLLRLVDELSRIRFFLRWQPTDGCTERPEDLELAQLAASSLDGCAQSIQGRGKTPSPMILDEAREAHRNETDEWANSELQAGNVREVEVVTNAGFHLRMAALSAELICAYTCGSLGHPTKMEGPQTAGIVYEVPEASTGDILKSNLTLRSPWLQLALRTGLALALAVAVVGVTQVDHGFWVVLGTLSALRLDALGTGRTALQAITGTVAGFILGSLVILAVGDKPVILWILLPICVFLAGFTPGAVSLPVGQASFTIFVIVFYGILQGPQLETGELRVLDITIGLVISLIVSALMWPRGIQRSVATSLKAAMHSATAALRAAFDQLSGGPTSSHSYDEAVDRARRSVALANETFDMAIAQSGPNGKFADSWSFVANSANHVLSCASLVNFLARGVGPLPDTRYDGSMLVCARNVTDQVNASVDAIDPEFANVRTNSEYDDEQFLMVVLADTQAHLLGPEFDQLNADVTRVLEGLEDQAARGENVGQLAMGYVYSRDWLYHVGWLAKRLSEVTREPVTSSSPGEPSSAKE